MMAQYYHGVINEAKAAETLKRVGLDHRLDHIPSHLSGESNNGSVSHVRSSMNQRFSWLMNQQGILIRKNGDIVLNLIKQLHEEDIPLF